MFEELLTSAPNDLPRFYYNECTIKVNYTCPIGLLKYLIHQAQSTSSVTKAKWHYQPFIKALPSFEGRSLFISAPYMNLMISTLKVQ